jgi:pimeloyl-ACP methyl ester carboxylesterase
VEQLVTDPSVDADPVENAPAGDAFYTPPDPLPHGDRGDLIYQRRLDNSVAALDDADNWLVLYRSQDAQGSAVATSGIIALPRREPPAGGFPVISWAHGTVGVADLCAPSRDAPTSQAHPMNVYVHTLLNALLREGWAVAMTDYEGLGTTGRRHPYLLGVSEAAGVLEMVRAARRLFGPRISSRCAIVGHSQGGQAALFAASQAPACSDLDLVGVAAIGPANHVAGNVRAGALLAVKNEGYGFTPLLLCGAMAGDPQIRPDQVLSDIAFRQYWPHVDQRCRAGLSQDDSWGGLLGTQQFRSPYPTVPNDDQRRFDAQLEAMNPAVTLSVPARIVQAADDKRVQANPPPPLKGTDQLVSELQNLNSNTGQPLIYQRYPEGEVTPDDQLGVHFATINHDLPHLIDWLQPLLQPAN